jgi:transcriptional regulator GlxA family with amidase domain
MAALRVVVLVRHGVMPMELGLVHQLFGSAMGADGSRLYDVVTCAAVPGTVRTDADFVLGIAQGTEALAEADTVIVPASHEEDEAGGSPDVLGEVRAGARIASICTGAFLLAAAGLLDGRRATTHWKSCDLLQRRYPAVRVDPDVLYVDEGEVLTSAGEASGIDLCLHLIRQDFGSAVANEVARTTVVPPHREGGQAQYLRRPVPESRSTSTGVARAWALDQLHRPVALQEMAARESMSVRTFTRRFRDETGLSPGQWLTQQRIDRARQLLEETDLTVDRIATEAGFGTGASLRQHLQAALGVSPSAYRATFRGTA